MPNSTDRFTETKRERILMRIDIFKRELEACWNPHRRIILEEEIEKLTRRVSSKER